MSLRCEAAHFINIQTEQLRSIVSRDPTGENPVGTRPSEHTKGSDSLTTGENTDAAAADHMVLMS